MKRAGQFQMLVTVLVLLLGWLVAVHLHLTGPEEVVTLAQGTVIAVIFYVVLSASWFVLILFRSRRRTAQQLEHLSSELEMMAAVAQHTSNATIVSDANRRIVWVNRAFTDQTGYLAGEAMGRVPADIVRSPLADTNTLTQIDQAIRNHVGINVDVLHRYKDGRDHWIQLLLSPMINDEGRFVGYVSVLVNIDEKIKVREALERALRETDALRQTLNRYAIVSETDRQGTITRVNELFVKISGYSEAELLGKSHRVVNSGVHPAGFWEHMWETISRGEPWSGEICNRAKDGSFYWVHSLISPFTGRDGLIEKYVSIRTDITPRRLAEEALEASREMLARTSSIAGIGGWYADAQTRALHLSDECRRILFIHGDESIGIDALWNHFVPQSRDKVREALEAVMRLDSDSIDIAAEVQDVLPGKARWVRLFGEMDWQDVHASRLVGAVQDISHQVEAQRRIEEEQHILRSAIDALNEAFVLFDQDDRLVFCNDKYREIYAPVKDQIFIGARYEDIVLVATRYGIFKESVGHEDEWVIDSLLRHRAQSSDRVRETRDGRWLRIIERKTPEGYHVGFRIDVTEFQNALQASNAAALSKGQFLANMSHEIRTPMNAILGMLQLLMYTSLGPDQASLVDKARNAASSLLGILNDILDFSKVEAGKMRLDPEPFGLDDLLRDLSVILSSTLGDKPLELVYDIDPDIPDALIGDALRLKQVLINLGGNAIKFTAAGEVILRLRLVGRSPGHVRIAFLMKDSGIGITQEQRQHIFSGFSQAESSTARRYGGTGLGLTISQRLVAMMGGELKLESTPGEGSEFSFEVEFPVATHVPGGRQAQVISGLSILLLVPHPLTRSILQQTAQAMHCSVHAADSLPSAGEWLHEQALQGRAPDLVLVDADWLDGFARPVAGPITTQVRTLLRLYLPADKQPNIVLLASNHKHLLNELSVSAAGKTVGSLVKPVTPMMVCKAALPEKPALLLTQQDGVAEPGGQRLAGLRLLLVEDNAINQEVAMNLLEREGAQVTVADNGQRGVEALRASSTGFDLVLMDMQMPVLDGLQATRAIRRYPRFQALPIVAMTANAMESDRQDCLAAGMNDHVGKPFDINTLVTLIRRLTGRSSFTSDALLRGPAEVDGSQPPAVLDVNSARQRLGGDEAFLQRLQASFMNIAPSVLQQAQQAVAQRDWSAAAGQLHQLKSHAGMVGADALARASAAAERSLKERACNGAALGAEAEAEAADAVVQAGLEALEQAISEALLALRQRLPTQALNGAVQNVAERAEAVPSVAVADLLGELDALQVLLKNSDMQAIEAHEQLLARYAQCHGALLEGLNQSMEKLDFEAAGAEAGALIKRLRAQQVV